MAKDDQLRHRDIDFESLKASMAEKGFFTTSEGNRSEWYFASAYTDDLTLNIKWDKTTCHLISAKTNGRVCTIVDLFPGDDCLYGLKDRITSTFQSALSKSVVSQQVKRKKGDPKDIYISEIVSKLQSLASIHDDLKDPVIMQKFVQFHCKGLTPSLIDEVTSAFAELVRSTSEGPDHGEQGVSLSLPGGSDATSVLGCTSEGPDHGGHGDSSSI